MVRLFQACKSFHFIVRLFHSFHVNLDVKSTFFWPFGLKNEGYTVMPLFLLVALRLLKSSDCIVERSDNINCNDLTMERNELLILLCKWRER